MPSPLQKLEAAVRKLTADVAELQKGQVELREGVAELRAGYAELRAGYAELRDDVVAVREGQEELGEGLNKVLVEVKGIQKTQTALTNAMTTALKQLAVDKSLEIRVKRLEDAVFGSKH